VHVKHRLEGSTKEARRCEVFVTSAALGGHEWDKKLLEERAATAFAETFCRQQGTTARGE